MIKNIFTSLVVSFIAITFALNVPAEWFNVGQFFPHQQTYGNVSLTTLNGTDNLTNFPTTYNANNLILNNGKIDPSSSSVAAITTLANLSTIGTVTTGTWNANTLTVPYGGTGSTTLSQYQVLLGNATGNVTTPLGWGTSGQFLTSNGVSTLPSWQSSTVNQTANYAWTGIHNFVGAATYIKNLISSSTIQINNGGSGVSYSFPTSNALGVLSNNGAGTLSWSNPLKYTLTQTNLTVTNGYATSSPISIPAGILTASSTISLIANGQCQHGTSSGACTIYLRQDTGATIWSCSDGVTGTSVTYQHNINAIVSGVNSASSQQTIANFIYNNATVGSAASVFISACNTTSAINLANAINLVVVVGGTVAQLTPTYSFSLVVTP